MGNQESITTWRNLTLTGAAVALMLAGCASTPAEPEPSSEPPAGDDEGGIVRVVTHDSFELPEELLEQFENATGYELQFSAPGDAGALVNQLILTKDSPLGDVVYGVDNSFAARAVNAGIVEDYESPGLPEGAADYLVDGHGLTPIDMGDVCLNVDHEWFAANDLDEPATFEDLLEEEYRGLTVLTNPAQSSPGMAFMLATISKFGDDWTGYWERLLDNDTKIVDGWSGAYYTDFTTNGGSRPIVLSYATSPAFTLDDDGDSTTGSLLETCFRQVEYAGVLAGAENPGGAQAFIDFLLSEEVQGAIPGTMYMYPVADVDLPEEWTAHAPVAPAPHNVDPQDIETNLDDWLRSFQDDVIG